MNVFISAYICILTSGKINKNAIKYTFWRQEWEVGGWEERQRNSTIFLKKKLNHEITLPNQKIKN